LYGWAVVLDFFGEALLMGDLLLALAEVGAGGSLAGDAALDLLAGEGLRPDTGAARLAGDFLFLGDSFWSTVSADLEVSAFAGLRDLVLATSIGAGESLLFPRPALVFGEVAAFVGLLDLVLGLAMGAGDLLVRRAGALTGLFERLLLSFTSVGCASTVFEGLMDRVLRASMGAGDLLTRRAGDLAGLWLRERTGLLIEDARSRLAGLFAGLFDLDAARLAGLVTRPAATRSVLSLRNSFKNSSVSLSSSSKAAGIALGLGPSPTASSMRTIGNESRGTSTPLLAMPARPKPTLMALLKGTLPMPFFRHSSTPSPTRFRRSFLSLR
jgi:hypothetical protein